MSSTKKTRSLWHPIYWPAWLGFGILWSITRLPHRARIRIGQGLGTILYWLPSKLKQITQINIDLCFPEFTPKERTQLMKKNFASLGVGLIEAAMAWWLPDKKLNYLFEIRGFEYGEEALKKGKGIILVGPHFTSLEMVGRLLGTKHSFAVMYRPHKKPFIAYIHEHFRKKPYVNYIPSHRVREMLSALKNNTPIWYAYDIDGGHKHSVFAPFFGIQTSSLTSVSRMAKLSGAAIIPIIFYRRDEDFKYIVELLPPVENFPTDDLVADATRLNAILEQPIREHRDQYVWQYKRFKTRPPGEKRFY